MAQQQTFCGVEGWRVWRRSCFGSSTQRGGPCSPDAARIEQQLGSRGAALLFGATSLAVGVLCCPSSRGSCTVQVLWWWGRRRVRAARGMERYALVQRFQERTGRHATALLGPSLLSQVRRKGGRTLSTSPRPSWRPTAGTWRMRWPLTWPSAVAAAAVVAVCFVVGVERLLTRLLRKGPLRRVPAGTGWRAGFGR